MTNVQDYLSSLNAAIDSRAAYEASKNADNNSIQSVLAALRKDFNRAEVIAQIMIDNSVNAEFINRQERSNNRYNVYAAQKVENAVSASANTEALNHYTLAILKVACALKTVSHKDAVSACSAGVKHSDTARERVIKSLRYAKHVAANTASTQSSSSLNALQTLNVISESRDANNDVIYSVNSDSLIFKALAARYELKLAE